MQIKAVPTMRVVSKENSYDDICIGGVGRDGKVHAVLNVCTHHTAGPAPPL